MKGIKIKDIEEENDFEKSNTNDLPKSKVKIHNLLPLLKKLIIGSIGLILIILGISMIVITAPSAQFEIATIYYFSPDDGITVTDLISLVISLSGLYLVINVFSNNK